MNSSLTGAAIAAALVSTANGTITRFDGMDQVGMPANAVNSAAAEAAYLAAAGPTTLIDFESSPIQHLNNTVVHPGVTLDMPEIRGWLVEQSGDFFGGRKLAKQPYGTDTHSWTFDQPIVAWGGWIADLGTRNNGFLTIELFLGGVPVDTVIVTGINASLIVHQYFGFISTDPFDSMVWTISENTDVTKIDQVNIAYGPCNAADTAPPYGTLDIDDVLTFLGDFAAGDPAADIAPPAGVLDIDDVLTFLGAFAGGCP